MVGTPSPAGGEGPLADWLAGWLATWGRHHGTEVPCTVDRFAPGRANLEVGGHGPGAVPGPGAGPENRPGRGRGPGAGHLVVYSHLDTTLSGDRLLDRPVVPGRVAGPSLVRRGDLLGGAGLGVAKGPAAAALLGFVLAAGALE
ncbi:MAG: hypothetical protein ACRDYZ_09155, partial [Acidimicrobiales bacterium]